MAKSTKKLWEEKFMERIQETKTHQRSLNRVVSRILKKASSAKGSMTTRSKKYNVEMSLELDDIRQMIYDYYGQQCKYCDKILTWRNMVFDHIIPISKGGPSTKENIQIICKTSNGVKGSLEEKYFLEIMDFLDTMPEHVRKDVCARMARGKN